MSAAAPICRAIRLTCCARSPATFASRSSSTATRAFTCCCQRLVCERMRDASRRDNHSLTPRNDHASAAAEPLTRDKSRVFWNLLPSSLSRLACLACLVRREADQEVCMNAIKTTGNDGAYDVVILGAGYAGLMSALRLCQKRQQLRIALVNRSDQFLERVR